MLATAALLLVRVFVPGRNELALDVYVLILGGMALLALVSWLRQAIPDPMESPVAETLQRRSAHPERIAELDRLERELYLGSTTAFDLHYRLRPVLREIAANRLERHGLQLDAGGSRVREALGNDLWEIVRPDREPPGDRHAPGPGLARMRRIVEQLEAVT